VQYRQPAEANANDDDIPIPGSSSSIRIEYMAISKMRGTAAEIMGNNLGSHIAAATSNSARNGWVWNDPNANFASATGEGSRDDGVAARNSLFSRMLSTNSARTWAGLRNRGMSKREDPQCWYAYYPRSFQYSSARKKLCTFKTRRTWTFVRLPGPINFL
jgi:hypothetical protein